MRRQSSTISNLLMASLNKLGQYFVVGCALAVHVSLAAKEPSYLCVGTSPCVKKFMSQIWRLDSDFFLLNITDENYATNCTEAQTCLNDGTGGGGDVSDVTTAAVSFIYNVCSKEKQKQFNETLKNCILRNGIRQKAENYHNNWLADRDSMLAIISKPNQVNKFCTLLKEYVANIEETLTTGGCTDENLNWCMKIIRENIYEKYGGFCLCVGNCDCKLTKSTSPVVGGNGAGAGYMMLVFGIFFLIGAILVKTRKRRK